MKNTASDHLLPLALFALVGILAACFYKLGVRLTVGPTPTEEPALPPTPIELAPTPIELAPGVQLFIDPYNGCQYLVTRHGMAPRMHSDGVQVCKDAAIQAEDALDRDFARLDDLRRLRF